ncbi:MAG: SIR2 family protein [Pseudomonadota bacterium]
MIDWPSSLINEIVKGRCVFFIGSGVSANSKDANSDSPPTWGTFLSMASALVSDKNKKVQIEKLIEEKKFLVALQAINDNCDQADYYSFLNNSFNKNYQPSELHHYIYKLDARIVITTNFDKIYQSLCYSYPGSGPAFKVIDYTSYDLADEIRSDTRLIINAHGSINNISNMIFTKSEYHKAKRNHPYFYEVLKAIFLTNTILFIGCGLEDPDIMLLLEDVKIYGNSNKHHYALTLKGDKNEFLINDWIKTYNIRTLEYEPNHGALVTEIKNLLELVDEERAALVTTI